MSGDAEIKVLLTADLTELKAGMDAAAESVAEASAAIEASVAAAGDVANASAKKLADAFLTLDSVMSGKIKTTEELAAAESALDALQEAGLMTKAQVASALAKLDEAQAALARSSVMAAAGVEAETAALKVNGSVVRETGVLIGEVVRGNWSRMEGSAATMANRLNVLQYAFTPLGAAILAATAAVGTFAYEAYEGVKADDELAHSLTLTNGIAGMTRDQMLELSSAMSSADVSARSAEQGVTKLATSGRFNAEQMQLAAQAAADMATVTGQSMDQAVDAVMKLQADPVEAVRALDQQFHFLSLTQMEEIEQLQKTGDATDAATAALNAFADAMANRAPEAVKETNLLKQAWQDVGMAIEGVGTRMSDALRDSTLDEKIAKINAQIQTLQDGQGVDSGSDVLDAIFARDTSGEIAALEQQRDALQKTKQAAEEAAQAKAKAAQVQTDGINAAKAFDSQFASLDRQNERLQKTIELEQQLKAIHDANPKDERVQGVEFDPLSGAAVGGAKLAELLAEINKKYQDLDTTTRAQHAAETQAARERKQAMAEELKDLQMQRDGTQENTAARIQADAEVLTNATKLYGADSSQQKAALDQMLTDEKSYDRSVLELRAQVAADSRDDALKDIDTKRQQYELEYAEGKITAQRLLELDDDLAKQKLAVEKAFYAAKEKLDAGDALAMEKNRHGLEMANKQLHDDLLANEKAFHTASENQWKTYARQIEGSIQSAVNAMLFQHQTLGKAIGNIAISMGEDFIQAAIQKPLEKWIDAESAKLSATISSLTSQATATEAQRTANTTADIQASVASVTRAAGVAGAQGTASFSGAPWPVDMGAPAFGAAMSLAALSYASVASAAGGWERVPFDGAMTELHRDEMVLPKHIADPVRQMAKRGFAGGGQDGIHVTVYANDAKSFGDQMRRRPDDFAKAARLAIRRGHLSSRR